VFGLAVMVLMAIGFTGHGKGDENPILLFFSGMVGSASMILPGVSGGYLLLLLGQYETILGAIDTVKLGLLGDSARGLGTDFSLVLESLSVVVPVGVGVVVGIVGVSNLLEWLLAKCKTQTLGVLFGLLLGAVIGLWPFQTGRQPVLGEVFAGETLVQQAQIDRIDPEDWPVMVFTPSPGQVGGVIVLILLGYGVTAAVDKLGAALGGEAEEASETAQGQGFG
jgi:putative membrane protein